EREMRACEQFASRGRGPQRSRFWIAGVGAIPIVSGSHASITGIRTTMASTPFQRLPSDLHILRLARPRSLRKLIFHFVQPAQLCLELVDGQIQHPDRLMI